MYDGTEPDGDDDFDGEVFEPCVMMAMVTVMRTGRHEVEDVDGDCHGYDGGCDDDDDFSMMKKCDDDDDDADLANGDGHGVDYDGECDDDDDGDVDNADGDHDD